MVAEDPGLLRKGLIRLLIDAGLGVVAKVDVGDGPALIVAVKRRRPEVAVVDVRLTPGYPATRALKAAIEIRRFIPAPTMLTLSQHVEERCGAELAARIRGGGRRSPAQGPPGRCPRLRRGGLRPCLGPNRARPRGSRPALGPPSTRGSPGSPHPRKQDALALMAEGRPNRAIAAGLFVGDGAVEEHVKNIFLELELAPTDTDHRRGRPS